MISVSAKAKRKWIAGAQRPLADVLAGLPQKREKAHVLLTRLRRLTAIPEDASICEVGAASGDMLAAIAELGYSCCGIEPSAVARATASQLMLHTGISTHIVDGKAEKLPFPDEHFDLVIADSVLEHVTNLERALAEAFRVLKPNGAFWFYTASALCPVQHEIKGFPFFGWYPNKLKRRIMNWAMTARPHLVAYSEAPAINWFTPWKAKRMLRSCGFQRVFDRWDILSKGELTFAKRFVVGTIRTSAILRFCADVCYMDCAYAAVK